MPARRRAVTAGRQSLVVACLVLLVGFGWAFASPAAGAEAEGGVSLFDDDGGRALFTAADRLAPGRPLSACVRVGTRTARAGDAVWFAAVDVSGALAPHVTVTLESGDGGRFGDCTGFTGTTLWTGTLDRLAAASAGNGLDTGWAPAAEPVRSFRVTVLMDPDLQVQGLTARGDLVWRLDRDVVVDPPGPTDTPTTEPPTTGPVVDPTPTTTPSATTSPTPTGTPTPAPTTAGTPGPTASPAVEEPDVDLDAGTPFLRSVREAAQRATAVAVAVVREPQYPLAALLVAALFLLVQDFIDRRDPKLAAASTTRREINTVFPDVFAPGRAGGRSG